MNTLHCFAGAGFGMLADRHLGHTPIAAVEIDEASRELLKLRWPDVTLYGDIREFNKEMAYDYAGRVDMVCGGFPCQDLSVAGKQAGMSAGSDTRSSLGFDLLRTIHRTAPRYAFVENVAAILSDKNRRGFEEWLGEFGHMGYGGVYCTTTARMFNGTHIRRRFWLLAKRGMFGFRHVGDFDSHKSRPMLPTPRVGGAGTHVFVRKDGKVRDDLETTAFMDAMGGGDPRGWSPYIVKQIIDGRRLNPGTAERLMRAPHGYTNMLLPTTPAVLDLLAPPVYATPEELMADALVRPTKNDHRARRLKWCGNAQDTAQAVGSYRILMRELERKS